MMKKVFMLSGALIFLLIPALVLADSISPSSFTTEIDTGDSVFVLKEVTIEDSEPAFNNSSTGYTTVSLDTSEAPSAVEVLVSPLSFVGDYDRSVERIFLFSVQFTDNAPGTHEFYIYAMVDGVRVASEFDSITSRGTTVPEPSTMLLLSSGLLGLWGLRRKFRK